MNIPDITVYHYDGKFFLPFRCNGAYPFVVGGYLQGLSSDA